MNLSEDETVEKYANQCKHCSQNTLLPYENEWSCIPCGFNLIKGNTNLLKFNESE